MHFHELRFFLFLVFTSLSFCLQAQTSHQGVWLPARGEVNLLVVYAEALNDPAYNDHYNDGWLPAQLPAKPEKYFDRIGTETNNGFVTEYFNRASYGNFRMKAVYWPKLIQVEFDKVAYTNPRTIAAELEKNPEIRNALVGELQMLDQWTPKPGFEPKVNKPDSMIDVIVVVWRINSHISKVNNTGYCAPNNQTFSVLGYKGVNCFSEFQSWDNNAVITMRHELSHAIIGGNNFHTGGAGAGIRSFIPSVGGYGMLNSFDSYSNSFSGWDRNRLGWKHPQKKFVTSAFRKTTNGLVEHAFEQNKKPSFANNTFLLRDFHRTGDAVSLRLPGPDSPRLNQYLWLELHTDSSELDFADTARHGVYAYIQVGKDDIRNTYNNSMTSPGNYTFSLPASGRWDFTYYRDSVNKPVLRKDYDKPNPVSGDHLLMRPLTDENNDGVLDKHFLPEVFVDGNHQAVERYMVFGNTDDVFKPRDHPHLGVSTNPSSNSLITHNAPNHRKSKSDSDTSFITGLDIRIRDTTAVVNSISERCALVDVRWNQFVIQNNVRWCGTIGLKRLGSHYPKLSVDSGCVLLLDRSLTSMQEKINTTDTLNGKLYFSPLTTFTLYNGTTLVMKKGSTLQLKGNSTLYVRKGAKLIFEDGAKLEATNGSIVYLD